MKSRTSPIGKAAHRISSAWILCLLTIAPNAWADLPLIVEDLITDKGKVKLDMSLAYANTDRRGISNGEPILVQTGPTSFVYMPVVFGERVDNTDTFVGTLGLRYGLTANTEVYVRASGWSSNQRTTGASGTSSQSESRFADTWAGVNYEFKRDDDTPGVVGFSEIALYERRRESSASFKSAMVGGTVYKAIDPVVFSLTAGYRFNRSHSDVSQSYKPGNLWLISPSVGFAVNDRVTLTTGAQWTRRDADRVDDESIGIDRTETALLLGAGYGIARGNTLNATFKVDASGSNGTEMRLNWLYTF